MYLKTLELSGFKSFAKKTTLDFSAPISGIVGPNGSGKSNIAEAFRFVLGEQSIKSLRGKRAEDLIWNGSRDIARSNRASAKVIFDNTRRGMNIDFDEVSIERVVHRDSSSEYFINGSQVRLKDIIELLASARIGSSGHHIISQGEADKILNANIKDRREMVEDALGLKIYQYKKQESQRKLEKTEENIESVKSLRREIAPHLKFLKKQVEKLEQANEMKERLKELYRNYFKREEMYLKVERTHLEEEKKIPEKRRRELEDELAKAKRILAGSSAKDVKSEELISIEGRLKGARFQKDSLTRDIGRIEGEINSLEKILKRQSEALRHASDKKIELREIEGVASGVHGEIETALGKDDILQVKNILRSIKDVLSGFISKHKSADNSSDSMETEKELRILKEERVKIDELLKRAEEEEKKIIKEYSEIREEIEREKDSSRDAEKAMFKIMAEQNEVSGKLRDVEYREDKLKQSEENFKMELKEAGILAGIGALHYDSGKILDENGAEVSIEDILKEDRSVQDERRRTIEKIKIRLEDAGIGSGDDVIKEYREANERDAFLARELEDLDRSAISLKDIIKELEGFIANEFKEGVHKINAQFQEFFSSMFGSGGHAGLSVIREKKKKRNSDTNVSALLSGSVDEAGELSVESEEEEGEEGVDIDVSLPRKKIKGLTMLSGGERALTSIALLFAISQVNPPPFIILDETDAALDEANSKKYGDMIENLSKYSQLILITHNRETMSRAGIIYGITMGSDGISRLLSIKFEEAVKVAK
ncbi:MAG: Chromosome partition protein smc [Parcubacteria group bacterium GW2011_GWC1_40_13]|nr:MAG: Chromosome partition protein smc [Parcubacteria group bacterium GW2011_GWC1_40_13]